MTGSTITMTLDNLTTVENLNKGTRTYNLAVLINPREHLSSHLQTTTYPLGQQDTGPKRTFAVLRTHPGQNPWHIGYLENLKTVMGERVIEWFLPVRYSPCCSHDRGDSDFPLGPVVEQLKREARILHM